MIRSLNMMLKLFFVLTTIVNISLGALVIENKLHPGSSDDLEENRDLKKSEFDENLQRAWYEWAFCTNAEFNPYFTPMTKIVPKNTLFLTTSFNCMFQTIPVTIHKGYQTIFMRVWSWIGADFADDWELGICGSNTAEEAEQIRQDAAKSVIAYMTTNEFQSSLYLKVDGVDVAPIFVNDPGPYYLIGCKDGRTNREYFNLFNSTGDSCDADSYQQFNGMDAYPIIGWWGKDTRTWEKGESHTFEFGVPDQCFTARYVITAK